MLTISNPCGLPVSLSGISNSPRLRKEMKDHDRRREAMKKMKLQDNMHGQEIIRNHNREYRVINGDASLMMIQDWSISLPLTAKAA